MNEKLHQQCFIENYETKYIHFLMKMIERVRYRLELVI